MPKKFSELDAATTLADADIAPLVQGVTPKKTVRTTLLALANFVIGKLPFATQAEAQTADSLNTVMSPVRVREFCESRGFGGTYTNVTANLNNAINGGFFSWNNTSTNTPVAASYGRGMTLPSSTGYLTQVGIINGTSKVYIRYQNGALPTDWSPWVLVAQPIA